jgi:hypothetical protein
MAGRKTLRSIRMARETSNGTRATPRYLWRGVGDWVVDAREIVKVEEQVGISGGTDRTYTPKLAATVDIAETEATYKQLVALFYSAGLTPRTGYNTFGTRVPALYTGASGSIWRYGLNVPSTVFPTTYSYTIEAGDNIESQVALYCVTDELKLTFEAGEAAKMSASMLAQYGTRTNAEGSFSEVGTLENVTVMLSSKTNFLSIVPLTYSHINWALHGVSSTIFWIGNSNGDILNRSVTEYFGSSSLTTPIIFGLFAVNRTNVWAACDSGVILYFDGTGWSQQTSGTSNRLRSVWGSAANSVWAVGDVGTILFYNGSTWASQTSGTSNLLFGVWGSAANSVWAVGDVGTILFYNGSTWAAQTSGVVTTLVGVWGSAANSVWAVGNSGAILFWNGSTWAAQTSGTSVLLNSVWGSAANSVWAVGNSGTILFYNGSTWTAQTSGITTALRAVWGSSATSVWAVGDNGVILFYDGSTWTNITTSSQSMWASDSPGNVLKAELTVKAQWAPKYWVDAGVLYPGTMVLTGHEITGNITFEHQNGGTLSAAGTGGQIEKWRNQQAQLLNMMWIDYDSSGSEVAFGFQLPFKWDSLQDYSDMDGNNIVSGDFTSKYNETYGARGFFFFHTGFDYANIVGTI